MSLWPWVRTAAVLLGSVCLQDLSSLRPTVKACGIVTERREMQMKWLPVTFSVLENGAVSVGHPVPTYRMMAPEAGVPGASAFQGNTYLGKGWPQDSVDVSTPTPSQMGGAWPVSRSQPCGGHCRDDKEG